MAETQDSFLPNETYPLFLRLTGKTALVVGTGGVGFRKIKSLLATRLKTIHAVSPTAAKDIQITSEATASPNLIISTRTFFDDDIENCALVYACTNNRNVNKHIAKLCHAKGILCNIADAPEESDFFVPAHFSQGPIHIAISTDGASPALARHLRQEMEQWLDNRYTKLACLLQRLRPLLLSHTMATEDNTRVFRILTTSMLSEYLRTNDVDSARQILEETLPSTLHCFIGDLLHDL